MALKTLLLRKKIDEAKEKLKVLREKTADFKKRAKELEDSIEEAGTEEEKTAVEEAIEAFDKEKDEHEQEISSLEESITQQEKELEELEEKERSVARPKTRKEERGERREVRTVADIRSLPMNKRAFEVFSPEERSEIVKRDDVKAFLNGMREMGGSKRAVNGGELNIPVVFLELISENMYRYSKLLNRVRVRDVNGTARQTIAGTVPEAVWTEMCGAINELTFGFNQVTLDGFKVAGFIPVCNSLLEDSDVNLASTIVEMISEAIGLAKDKSILYGKGSVAHMPMGVVTRLSQTQKPDSYPVNAPEWVDLHISNIIKIAAELTGVEFWSALMLATGNTFTTYSRGRQFWAMNSKTFSLLKSKAITFTASGEIVSSVYGTLPIINGDIDILEFIPDGDIIGGYGDLYIWANRGGMSIESSEHVQFIQDNTVFRGVERADGMPIIPGAFVAININGNEVTTAMAFAADTANDAKLQDLAINGVTITPQFDEDILSYTGTTTDASGKIEATTAVAGAEVAIAYNGKNVRNGGTITFETGTMPVSVTVKKGNQVRVYTVTVTKGA